jgi:hypothetical protein
MKGLVLAILSCGLMAAAVPRFTGPAPQFPAPVVSASTVAMRSPDSVKIAVQWVRRCAGTVCPSAYLLTATRRSPDGYSTEVERTKVNRRDTLVVARPMCSLAGAAHSDTISVAVRAAGSVVIEPSVERVTKLPVRCRPLTLAERREEAAFADSFPSANWRIVVSDWGYKLSAAERSLMRLDELRKAKTFADSAKTIRTFASVDAAPDSIFKIQHPTDSVTAQIGFKYQICLYAKNRYTQYLTLIDGDELACAAVGERLRSLRRG